MGTSCMAVSREHLTLPKQLGLKHLVVFINKCDAAYEEMIELVEMEIRELLEEMGFILSKGLPSVLLRTRSLSWGWRPSTSSLIEGVENQTIPNPREGLLDHREAGAGQAEGGAGGGGARLQLDCHGQGDWHRDVLQDLGGGQCWGPDGSPGQGPQAVRREEGHVGGQV